MTRSPQEIEQKLAVLEKLLGELNSKMRMSRPSYEMTMNMFLLQGYISCLKWVSGQDDRFDILVMQKTLSFMTRSDRKN